MLLEHAAMARTVPPTPPTESYLVPLLLLCHSPDCKTLREVRRGWGRGRRQLERIRVMSCSRWAEEFLSCYLAAAPRESLGSQPPRPPRGKSSACLPVI